MPARCPSRRGPSLFACKSDGPECHELLEAARIQESGRERPDEVSQRYCGEWERRLEIEVA
jgi:hypothetical protein